MNKYELLHNSNVSIKSIKQSGSTEYEHDQAENREKESMVTLYVYRLSAISPQMKISIWVFYFGILCNKSTDEALN